MEPVLVTGGGKGVLTHSGTVMVQTPTQLYTFTDTFFPVRVTPESVERSGY